MELSELYIDCPSVLKEWCLNNKEIQLLGLDTEFLRADTYFPKLCLIQVSTINELVIIDPICIGVSDLEPLLNLLTNPNIIKIIHSSNQDIEALFTNLQIIPKPLFDTQLAQRMLDQENTLSISYQLIVNQLFNVILEKDQTRTDWKKRPLDQAQLEYAFDDVRFLIPLYRALIKKLETNPAIFMEFQKEMFNIVDINRYLPQMELAWKKINHKNQVKGKALELLKELAMRREQLAIQENLPKRWIIRDESLIILAKLYTKIFIESEPLHIKLIQVILSYQPNSNLNINIFSDSKTNSLIASMLRNTFSKNYKKTPIRYPITDAFCVKILEWVKPFLNSNQSL